MLKQLLKSKIFNELIKEGLNEKDVLDIFLFGSVVRGKEEPNDIDLLVVYVSKEDTDYNYELRKKLEREGFKVHVNGISYKDLFNSSFFAREGILFEGYSFKSKDFLTHAFGFSSFMLFRYHFDGMNNSDRMRFYYALYGRNNEKGVMEEFNCYKQSFVLFDTIIPSYE